MGEFAYQELNSNLPSAQTYSVFYLALFKMPWYNYWGEKYVFVIHIFEKKVSESFMLIFLYSSVSDNFGFNNMPYF